MYIQCGQYLSMSMCVCEKKDKIWTKLQVSDKITVYVIQSGIITTKEKEKREKRTLS